MQFIKHLSDNGLLTLLGILISVVGWFITIQRTKNIQNSGVKSINNQNGTQSNIGNKYFAGENKG